VLGEQQEYPPLLLIEQIFPGSHMFGGQVESEDGISFQKLKYVLIKKKKKITALTFCCWVIMTIRFGIRRNWTIPIIVCKISRLYIEFIEHFDLFFKKNAYK